MDSQDPNSPPKSLYHPAYAHIEKKVRDAIEKINQFDEQIKNMPNDRGLDLSYNPPAFIKSRQMGSRDQVIISLEKAKAQLKTETWKEVEQELKGKNSTFAKQARDLAREEIYPNSYLVMAEAQNKAKDIEQSQDFMDATLINVREKRIEKEQNNISEKSNIDTQSRDIEESQNLMNQMTADFKQKNNLNKENISPQDLTTAQNNHVSLSVKFSQSLNYTRNLEKSDKSIEPSRDKESPDRD
jgi:hypothetical protein